MPLKHDSRHHQAEEKNRDQRMKDGFKNVENGLCAQVEEDGGRRI